MANVNWVYRIRSVKDEQAIYDRIRNVHFYKNDIVAEELSAREKVQNYLAEYSQEYRNAVNYLAILNKQLEELREAVQQEKVKQRKKVLDDASQLVASVRAKLDEVGGQYKTMREIKSRLFKIPEVKDYCDQIRREQKELLKKIAKTNRNISWGEENAANQELGSVSSGPPPSFKRFEGEGQVYVQFQKQSDRPDKTTYDLKRLGEKNGKLELELSDELLNAWDKSSKTPRRLRVVNGRLRVASGEKRSPIWCDFELIMHRSIPREAIVKGVYLERRMMGPKPQYWLRLQLEIADPTPIEDVYNPKSFVAVHFGWKKTESGLEAATWIGSDGKRGSVVLSDKHLADYEKLVAIGQKRDVAFNEKVAKLTEFLKSKKSLPDEMVKIRQSIHLWKSQRRLVLAVMTWSNNRFKGDDLLFDEFTAWVKFDRKLWASESRLSKRIARRRNDNYRVVAARLREDYEVVYYSKIELAKLKKKGKPEELKRDEAEIAKNASRAAIAKLITMLKERFPLRYVEVDSKNITKSCSNCGSVVKKVDGRNFKCGDCGHSCDVNENALNNTIARGEVMVKNGLLLELVQQKGLEAQKKLDRLAKMQEANRTARKKKKENGENKGD